MSDRAFKDCQVQALLFVEALVDGGKVAGELGLRHPLELQANRSEFGASVISHGLFGAGIPSPGRRSDACPQHQDEQRKTCKQPCSSVFMKSS